MLTSLWLLPIIPRRFYLLSCLDLGARAHLYVSDLLNMICSYTVSVTLTLCDLFQVQGSPLDGSLVVLLLVLFVF